MRKYILLIIGLLLLYSTTMDARRRRRPKPKKIEVVENPKFTAMLSYTAKINIIDSIVVDSTKYLDHIFPNPEEGRLIKYADFFKKEGDGIVYLNELGNKCIYSYRAEGEEHKMLYQSDLLSDGWTVGEPLKGIDADGKFTDFDYPYLMPDGITLYFCAKSSEGLGGYDIYRTRYDQEGNKFLNPENMGLPFNSDADDYMFVVDEQNKLAYFASNRRQPQGKTCVYTFIPFETRHNVTGSDDHIRSLARIDRIADTWGKGTERKEALGRKAIAQNIFTQKRLQVQNPSLNFVINDQVTYHSITDFRVKENQDRLLSLLDLQRQEKVLKASLQKSRDYYATATKSERQTLASEILNGEQQLEMIAEAIHQLEKTIRNTENQ